MANRVFAGQEEGMTTVTWIENVPPFAQKVLEALKLDQEEVSVFFCTDGYIKDLNKTYRDVDEATDVLSFEDGGKYTDESGEWLEAGDVTISVETLKKNAENFNTSENEELKRLLIHGILHLNGYDHGSETLEEGKEPQGEMLVLQENLMKQLAGEVVIG